MIVVQDLPALNATLNSLSAVLVTIGYFAIRSNRVTLHKACMLAAVGVSALFLVSYVTLHIIKGSTEFPLDYPAARIVYFAILISHATLAVVVTPLVLITAYLGLRDRLDRHVRLARWTLPIWLYVSVTGVIVYAMLYHLYPASP